MELGTRTRRAAIGCCVALAVAGSTVHPATAAPKPPELPLPPGLIDAVRRDLGIDAREYLRRTEIAQQLTTFAKTARIAHPLAFAGIRMDGPRPIVLLTNGVSAGNARKAAEQAGFAVETVADNEATLRIRSAAFERWLAGQAGSVSDAVIGYGIDVVHNSLSVQLAKDVQLPAEAGPVRSISTVMPEARPDDSRSPVRSIADAEPAGDAIGGQPYSIELAGKAHKCSFGFNATDADGHAVNITAGHCDPNNLVEAAAKTAEPQRIYEAAGDEHGTELGRFEYSNLGPNDYAILRINDAAAPRFQNNLVSTGRVAPPPAQTGGGTGSAAMPPAGSSGPTPPGGNGAGAPGVGNGNTAPPVGNGTAGPPVGNGTPTRPADNSGATSPADISGTAPVGDGNATPPGGNGGVTTPQRDSGGAPPVGHGDGIPNAAGPPPVGNAPAGNGTPAPPAGNGGVTPPADSSGTPPAAGDAQRPDVPVAGAVEDVLAIDGTVEPVEGASVCKSGFKSGYSCGTVIAVGQKGLLRGIPGHDNEVIKVDNMFYTDVCAQRGDSGGPIFAGTKAVGINSAIIMFVTPLDNGCGHLPVLLGQPVSKVLAENPGLTIRTN